MLEVLCLSSTEKTIKKVFDCGFYDTYDGLMEAAHTVETQLFIDGILPQVLEELSADREDTKPSDGENEG